MVDMNNAPTDLTVTRNSPKCSTSALYSYDSLDEATVAAARIASREVAPGFEMMGAVATQWVDNRRVVVATFDRFGAA